MSKLQSALILAEYGFRVFPLKPNGKRPLIDDFPERATTEREQIEEWWSEEWEHANIGVLTGGDLAVADLDDKNDKTGSLDLMDLEMAHGVLPETFTVRTPTGGRHLYFRTAGGLRNSTGKVAKGIDIRGHHGYVVAPGSTIDGKAYEAISGDRPAAMPAWLEQQCGYYVATAAQAAPAIEDVGNDAAIAIARNWLLREAETAVEGAAGDLTTFRVAARLKDLGATEQQAVALLLDHWNDRCAPPWPADQLAQKVANAYRYGREPVGSAMFDVVPGTPTRSATSTEAPAGPATTPPDNPFAPQPLEPFEPRALPRRKFILGHLLLRKNVTVLIAPPGVGKSTLTIEAALSIASGKPILGLPVKERTRVWLWNNEDPQDELKRRTAAAMQHFGLGFDQLRHPATDAPMVYMNSGEHRALQVAARTSAGDVQGLRETEAFRQVVAHAREHEIGVIVVDPFAETHGGQENANEDILFVAGLYRRLAQAANCAVLLVHHTRKPGDASSTGYAGDMNSGRGASALSGVARVVATLYGMSLADAERFGIPPDRRNRYVRLDDAKANMSLAAGEAAWFERVSVDLATWDAGEEAGLPDEDGRPVVFESVGVLAPVTLTPSQDEQDLEAQQTAGDILGVFRDGETVLRRRDVVDRLLALPMYAEMKREAVKKRVGRSLKSDKTVGAWILSLRSYTTPDRPQVDFRVAREPGKVGTGGNGEAVPVPSD